ncbi:MAG: hypothetical protein ABSF75_12140 [Terracidiphilus sp.]|jgi:hypothetical protein
MLLDSESSGMRDPRYSFSALLRSWIGLASIAGLISASTIALLLCPCDRPAGSFYSVFLASLSGFFALAAAGVLYVRLRKDKAATSFISGFEAIAMAAIAVYAELRVALYVIQWLALHRH